MTRSQKISKLANAIRAYRGMFHPLTGGKKQWVRHPQQSARDRITVWLERLKLNVQEGLVAIDGFASFEEMRTWLNKIE